MQEIKLQLSKLLDKQQCFDAYRSIRWAEGVVCPHCQSKEIRKNGQDSKHKEVQHYECKGCKRYFDDLTETIFSGSHHPLTHWITVLYLMNLNISNAQIADDLEISESTVYQMCSTIREGVVKKNLIYSLAALLNLTRLISLQDIKDSLIK
jgi:transposase-like protein